MGGYSNSITDINNRVGIGITSPSNKLDVNGFIRTSGNIGGLLIGHGSGDYGIKIGRNRTGDGQAYLDFIGSPDPTSGTFDTRFFKNAGDNGSFQIIHNGTGNFEINTTNGADTVFLNGNVGIGTSSPGDPLTVVGKISSLGGTNNAKNVKIYANDSFGYLTTNASKIYMSTQLQVDSGLIGSYNEDLQLQVSGSTKMYINSAGNVGIGTTSPVHRLHVDSGSIQLRDKVFYSASGNDTGSGTANGFAATLNDYHGTTLASQWTYKISITTTGTGTYNSSSYIVYRNSADTAWVSREISRSGTSSNHPELTISGNNAIIYDDHTSTYTVRYTVESRYTGQSKTSPHIMGSDYHWQRTDSDLYYTDGNVGIGTTSPGAKLEVSGNLRVTGVGNFFNYVSATGFRLEPNQTIMFDNGEDGFCYIKAEDSSFNMEYYSAQDHYFKSGEDFSYTDIYANNFILGSDARIKENVNNLDIKPINAGWKSFNIITKKEDYRVGVIAQELEENHPEFVNTDDEGFKTVKYIDLLIAKIAELEARLEKLEK